MNKAITDGVVLMPPAFANGLDLWSSGDGTPGSDTYENALNAAYVPADQDFGGCLELQKIDSIQKVRYMGETPLLPGCYLQVKARIKAVSGALPNVRIAAWAGGAGGTHVSGLTEVGDQVTLTQYGEVVEVTAIIGAGNRGGVDMVWGAEPLYGHFGIDLTGSNGGVVRIDDIEIVDITSAFLREMMAWVDVRDYGAVGDGVTDDQPAFEAADAAANGRKVLVSAGTYFLGDSVTFDNKVEFEGTVTMAEESTFALTKNYDLPTYIAAFGNEELAFRKAFQALLNGVDHESLDLGGRRITLTRPVDMQAAVSTRTSYATRRMIRNGQFYAANSADWEDEVVTSTGTYSINNSLKLTGVTNVANIQVGSLITGNGVGREIYVRAKNEATQEITLSKPLYDAEGTQTYTFTRFKFMLDFSGFSQMSKFGITDVEFQCSGRASAILLAPSGLIFHLRDSFVTRPKDRGLASPGEGCQGMLIDRCQFLSNDGGLPSQNRSTVAIVANGSDVKIRDNRASKFRHFAVLGGTSSIVTGNHFFQGDSESNGIRVAGIILTAPNCRATITANYVDNCFIEWTNERKANPSDLSGLPFSQLTIAENVFLCSDVAPWFRFIVVKPFGANQYIKGMTVIGNSFRTIHGAIDRVEEVDTSFADLDKTKFTGVKFEDNQYTLVSTGTHSPYVVDHHQATEDATWVIDGSPHLPFGGRARSVSSLLATSKIKNAANVTRHEWPYVSLEQGVNGDQVHVNWEQPVRGDISIALRVDDPN
ncbi:MAG: hypothetical protein CSA70_09130 [Rhodobacterales bacterium]|nr:MAG: hypothetical protein CSA70_09130 [Rhodobacterales bacterium]